MHPTAGAGVVGWARVDHARFWRPRVSVSAPCESGFPHPPENIFTRDRLDSPLPYSIPRRISVRAASIIWTDLVKINGDTVLLFRLLRHRKRGFSTVVNELAWA